VRSMNMESVQCRPTPEPILPLPSRSRPRPGPRDPIPPPPPPPHPTPPLPRPAAPIAGAPLSRGRGPSEVWWLRLGAKVGHFENISFVRLTHLAGFLKSNPGESGPPPPPPP
jgi:hypothetical protein